MRFIDEKARLQIFILRWTDFFKNEVHQETFAVCDTSKDMFIFQKHQESNKMMSTQRNREWIMSWRGKQREILLLKNLKLFQNVCTSSITYEIPNWKCADLNFRANYLFFKQTLQRFKQRFMFFKIEKIDKNAIVVPSQTNFLHFGRTDS